MLKLLLAVALSGFPIGAMAAQDDVIPGRKGPPVHTFIVKEEPLLPGWQIAAVQGRADANGYRFIVPSLDVMQPVSVMLVSSEGGDGLELSLFKDDFEKPIKMAATTDRSSARFNIRTMGPLRLKVSSKSGVKPYRLYVAVGSEVKLPVPSLYVPMAGTADSPTGGESNDPRGNSLVMWVIAGALVLIVVLLALMLMRKGRAQKAAAILLALAIPAAAVTVGKAQDQVSQEAQDYDPLKPEAVSYEDIQAEIREWTEWLLNEKTKMGKAVLDLYEALTPRDETLEPNYAGMPGIPTACVSKIPEGTARAINDVDWTGPCGECFAEAHDSVATTLQRFEKLRRVNAQTKDVYDKSIAFGDAASQVGGMRLAVAWMKIRKGITEKMDKYYVTYDDKVEELSQALVSSLQKVAACEGKYFKNSSWYERYGFMFVTPIVERHRR